MAPARASPVQARRGRRRRPRCAGSRPGQPAAVAGLPATVSTVPVEDVAHLALPAELGVHDVAARRSGRSIVDGELAGAAGRLAGGRGRTCRGRRGWRSGASTPRGCGSRSVDRLAGARRRARSIDQPGRLAGPGVGRQREASTSTPASAASAGGTSAVIITLIAGRIGMPVPCSPGELAVHAALGGVRPAATGSARRRG